MKNKETASEAIALLQQHRYMYNKGFIKTQEGRSKVEHPGSKNLHKIQRLEDTILMRKSKT